MQKRELNIIFVAQFIAPIDYVTIVDSIDVVVGRYEGERIYSAFVTDEQTNAFTTVEVPAPETISQNIVTT